jgi:hypothetical protein
MEEMMRNRLTREQYNAVATMQVYRGYVITPNIMRSEWHVSKGGSHITTQPTIDRAREAIDAVVG